jgi:t-SNARE complex subunit (syntaxin)
MEYPEAIVIDIVDDEPSIEGEVIDIDNSVHWDMAQRKVMCCLTISITVFIMVVFVYSLSNS